MHRGLVIFTLFIAGCASREQRAQDDAVSTTSLTNGAIESISLVGETRSGLVVNLELGPSKLTLRRRDSMLVFRTDGVPSSRLKGAIEFGPSAMVITKEGLDEGYDGEASRFVETFGDTIYGDAENVAPPAPTPSWNALVILTEQGTPLAETVSLRKVRR